MMFGKKKKTNSHLFWTCKRTFETLSNFEQWNFISNEILKGKEIENPISYALLVFFQRY
jgi:hypothetical protein